MTDITMHSRLDVRIHPTADVCAAAEIGVHTQIWNQAQVREGARIGRNCILGKDVYVDIGVEIGDNVKIQNGALIYHGTTIESGAFVGPSAIFANDKRPRSINSDGTVKSNLDWQVGQIIIRQGASIGAGAIILPGVTIGAFALVGAGAVVAHDVADQALVLGNPARQVGYVCVCATQLRQDGCNRYVCPACDTVYQFGESSHDSHFEAIHR